MTPCADAAASGAPPEAAADARRRAGAWLAASLMAMSCFAASPSRAESGTPRAAKPRVKVSAPAYVFYTTQAGDTLYDIARHYLSDPHGWAELSRLNNVPAPRRMPAGLMLRLPANELRQDHEAARVIATSGPVERAFGADNPAPKQLLPRVQSGFLPLTQGSVLGEGDQIRTGENGFVTLELEDGSHVTVSQDGMLDIAKLRHTVLTGAGDRVLQLKHGEVESQVTRATKKDDRFQIRSPSVVAGVRGTRFKVAYDGQLQTTAVEVLDGAVGVDPTTQASHAFAPPPGVPLAASARLVKARFGSVTRAGAAVGGPVELLPPLALTEPAKVQDGATVAFDLVPARDAAAYRVQISRDADQLDLIRDLRVTSPHVDFGELPDGTYFVRLTAIDHNGLEGLPQVYSFERRQLGLSASAEARDGTRDYAFRWFVSRSTVETHFRFVLATSADLRHPLVDRTDLTGGELVVTDLPAGVYYWTIVAEQFENGRFYEKSSAIRSFTLAR